MLRCGWLGLRHARPVGGVRQARPRSWLPWHVCWWLGLRHARPPPMVWRMTAPCICPQWAQPAWCQNQTNTCVCHHRQTRSLSPPSPNPLSLPTIAKPPLSLSLHRSIASRPTCRLHDWSPAEVRRCVGERTVGVAQTNCWCFSGASGVASPLGNDAVEHSLPACTTTL